MLGADDVNAVYERFEEEYEESEEADAELEESVNAQRMLLRGPNARQPDATDAKAAHKGGEQKAQRDGGGPDGKLQQLIPDGFIDERRTTTRCKEQHQKGKI